MRSTTVALVVAFALASGCAATQHSQPSTASVPALAEIRSEHGYTRNVAVLVFEGVELLDFSGPVEVFTNTRRWDEPLRVFTVGADLRPVRTLNAVMVQPDFAIDTCPVPDILVIPGGEVRCLGREFPLGRFILEQAPRVEIVFSVCNGVFCLADAGLLDGLEATTHWTAIGWLREAAPRTVVRDDRRFVDNGHIVTAAGISAGIDGALHLVDRLLGPAAARETARRMEYEWRGAPSEPDPDCALIERARRAWYLCEWKNALADYSTIVAEHPDDTVALARLGTCQLFTKQPNEALVSLQRALELGLRDKYAYHALGITLSRLDRHAEALDALTQTLAFDPNSLEVRRFVGEEQLALGNYRDALANMQAAWDAGQGDTRMLGKIARAQAALGNRSAAIASLTKVAEEEPGQLAALLADPAFDELRDDPRVAQLERRVSAQ